MKKTCIALLGFCLCVPVAHAYTTGSGSLYSDNFEGPLDDGWEMGNGFGASPSPWTFTADAGDTSWLADGNGPFFGSLSRHWARHTLHPVTATSASAALEFRAELGDPTWYFFFEFEQRAEIAKRVRWTIDTNGTLRLATTNGGTLTERAVSAAGLVPSNQRRWLRFAVEDDVSGHPAIKARVWSGGAGSEPATWDLVYIDVNDTLERIHRLTVETDGPAGDRTWLDDLDVWGDVGDGVASSIQEIWMVEVSHLDIGFTEPPDEIETFGKTHLDLVLNNLDADPEYRWTIETGWWLDRWWERSTATEQQRMVDALHEGRLTLTAGYANQTTTMLGHEELIRNIYWSSAFGREHGVPIRTWITDDVPGSSFAVPEILARAGIDYYLGGMNTGFGGRITEPDHGDRPFWWEGPDGSRVLSWITFDSYAEGFQYGFSFFDGLAEMYDKLAVKLPEQEEAGYPWVDLMLMRGFDNHYQGFKVRNLIQQWNATYATPKFRMASSEEFLDYMRQTHGDGAFPTYRGDFGAAWARSRASSPHTRQRIRQAHRDARTAESLLSGTAAMDGGSYPVSDVALLYRKLLESDEHTGAGGWPEYFTPEEMDRNNRIHLGYATDARDISADLKTQALDRLLADLPVAAEAIVAINPLGRARDGWVRAILPAAVYGNDFNLVDRTTSTELAFQRFSSDSSIGFHATDLPAWGYRVYDLIPGAPTATPGGSLQATATSLENDSYQVTLDPATGALTSIFDKLRGRELIDGSSSYKFNELATNTKLQYDSQSAPVAEPPTGATSTLTTGGPLFAEIKIARSGTPHIETSYRMYRHEDRLEVENVLDRDLVPYVPQATSVRAYMVTYPFDVHNFDLRTETTTRFLDPVADSFARTAYFDYHNAEHVLQFRDANFGVRLATDAIGAHHIENLSSLSSAAYSTTDALILPRLFDAADEYTFDGGAIGPFTREPDTPPLLYSMHSIQASDPGIDDSATSRFGFQATTPIEARFLSAQPGNLPDDRAGYFHFDAATVLPTVVKRAEDGNGLVLRITELEGLATTVAVGSDLLTLTDPRAAEIDEDPLAPLTISGNGFLVDLTPYQTQTIRVQATAGWDALELTVNKDAATGEVVLEWTGGNAPYTLRRDGSALFPSPSTLVDEFPIQSHRDPGLNDGNDAYYIVR